MNIYIIAALIFLISVVAIQILVYVTRVLMHPDRSRIRKKLRKFRYREKKLDEELSIERKIVYSDISSINDFLRRITHLDRLHRLLYQANSRLNVGSCLLLCIVFGVCAYLLLVSRGYPQVISLPTAALAAVAPLLYQYRNKRKRMREFLEQLPEGLDLLARALKAGHAFSTGMKMVADEFQDPLGSEFSTTIDQINFGIAVPDALRRMTERVECPDLNFFVVAVILQRETGGNLAHIIENIASLIRQRFAFQGKVQVLASEGLFSMWVLLALPFVVAGAIYFINPGYMQVMLEHPIGNWMIAVALINMLLGFIIMRSMVKIEV